MGGLESFRGEMLQASSSSKSGNSLGVYRCFIFTCLDTRVSISTLSSYRLLGRGYVLFLVLIAEYVGGRARGGKLKNEK